MEAVSYASSRSVTSTSCHGVLDLKLGTSAPVGLGVRPLRDVAFGLLPARCRTSMKISRSWDDAGTTRASVAAKAALMADDLDVVPTTSNDPVDQQQGGSLLTRVESVSDQSPLGSTPGGFAPDPPFSYDLSSAAATSSGTSSTTEVQVLVASSAEMVPSSNDQQLVDRAINAAIVGAAGAYAIAKILTVDHDYWHGWTIVEIVRYAPLHNWSAYEEALKTNPVLAKMMISGIVYALGDWIAQCCEGKPLLDFSRGRMIRSGLVGFCLHGSLSHFYYHVCEALFPFQDWWGVPIKVAFDQTIWSAIWNSIYFTTIGLLRFESPASIASELRATFWPMLTAGWKLWPFAHIITYGVIPVEQRLLWVDCVELAWVTILSMLSNEKAEARLHDGSAESESTEESSLGAE
ncbi:hypothetical protein KP509_19G035500 [Ceratopteris richardii]|uniref:Uncharacterized protein n=2 Tax=Ceratopteris richardii TaxID=49495 RepID=A0A8T2SMY0_CERRI|nr:hypothetical protein KP509_19G035500 [Ceratopteris richardii]